MKDRVAGAPGQYKASVSAEDLLKMQAGEEFTIQMQRDDQPIEEGTPYSKAAVLPDELAKVLCPDIEDPTPADALDALALKIFGALPLRGGTMNGPIDMAGQNIQNVGHMGITDLSVNGTLGAAKFFWNNLVGFRALNGVVVGGFRLDTSDYADIPTYGNKWSILVGITSPGGYTALYYIAGEDKAIKRTYKICGDENYGIQFAISATDGYVSIYCPTDWSVGWYITTSTFEDLAPNY